MARPLLRVLNEHAIEQMRILMVKLLPEIDVSIATGQYIVCAVLGYAVAQKRHHTDPEMLYEFVLKLCGERTWRAGSNLRERIAKFVDALYKLAY